MEISVVIFIIIALIILLCSLLYKPKLLCFSLLNKPTKKYLSTTKKYLFAKKCPSSSSTTRPPSSSTTRPPSSTTTAPPSSTPTITNPQVTETP